MRRRAQANMLAIMLAIGLVIALFVMLWLYSSGFFKGQDVILAEASLVQNKYVSDTQVVITSLRLTSKTDKLLEIRQVLAYVTTSDGEVKKVTFEPSQDGSWDGSGDFGTGCCGGSGETKIEGGKSVQLQFYFKNTDTQNPIISITFQVTLRDRAGRTYTVNSNEVSVE